MRRDGDARRSVPESRGITWRAPARRTQPLRGIQKALRLHVCAMKRHGIDRAAEQHATWRASVRRHLLATLFGAPGGCISCVAAVAWSHRSQSGFPVTGARRPLLPARGVRRSTRVRVPHDRRHARFDARGDPRHGLRIGRHTRMVGADSMTTDKTPRVSGSRIWRVVRADVTAQQARGQCA